MQIFQYYKEVAGTKIAQKIVSGIKDSTIILGTRPFIGQKEDMLKPLGEGHRYLVKGNYKIIYLPSEKIIHITDVFDTRQNPKKLKKHDKN